MRKPQAKTNGLDGFPPLIRTEAVLTVDGDVIEDFNDARDSTNLSSSRRTITSLSTRRVSASLELVRDYITLKFVRDEQLRCLLRAFEIAVLIASCVALGVEFGSFNNQASSFSGDLVTSEPTNSPSTSPTFSPTVDPTSFPTSKPSAIVPTPFTSSSPTATCNIETIIPRVFGLPSIMQYGQTGLNCLRTQYFASPLFRGVTYLNLYRNNILSIPKDAFEGLANLGSLYLHYNMISTVDRQAFGGENTTLAKLKLLSLSYNEIEVLPPGLFVGLSTLKALDLSRNPFSRVDANALIGLAELTRLTLRVDPSALQLPIGFLSELARLEFLNLFGWKLGPVLSSEKLPLASDETLEELDLRYCSISSVDDALGKRMSQLTRLFLSSNSLSAVPSSLGSLSKLQSLYLDDNVIRSFEISSGLSELTLLRLTNNQLSSIPTQISTLTKLRILYLDGNYIKSVPQKFFQDLAKLTTLRLGDNPGISLNNGSFAALHRLKDLYLYESGISDFPENVFSKLSSLTSLILGRNEVDVERLGIAGLSNLETLILNECSLSTLSPQVFPRMRNLKWLSLNNNNAPFSFPPSIFSTLTALTRLDVFGIVSVEDFPCLDTFVDHTGLTNPSVVWPRLPPC